MVRQRRAGNLITRELQRLELKMCIVQKELGSSEDNREGSDLCGRQWTVERKGKQEGEGQGNKDRKAFHGVGTQHCKCHKEFQQYEKQRELLQLVIRGLEIQKKSNFSPER